MHFDYLNLDLNNSEEDQFVTYQGSEWNHWKLISYTWSNTGVSRISFIQARDYQSLKPNHTQEEFIISFGAKFKNTDLVELLPFHAKKINFKVEQAYNDIVTSIKEIQKEIPQSNLRTIAESDLTKVNINRTKLQQCNTPFCLVVLKCSGYGQYNIVYAIVQNVIDQIGNTLISNLLRKIYEHTSHELSKFLQVYSLKDDCFSDFEEVLKMSASKVFIRITQH